MCTLALRGSPSHNCTAAFVLHTLALHRLSSQNFTAALVLHIQHVNMHLGGHNPTQHQWKLSAETAARLWAYSVMNCSVFTVYAKFSALTQTWHDYRKQRLFIFFLSSFLSLWTSNLSILELYYVWFWKLLFELLTWVSLKKKCSINFALGLGWNFTFLKCP